MKIATLLGTSRPGNYSKHALALVEDELKKRGTSPERFDPADRTLPFPGQAGDFPDAGDLRRMVGEAEGVVIATPEYHGSFPAMLKLILENMGFPSALKGKPVALLGVAAGRIGAIKSLEQLRSVCAHTGAIVLPSVISIAGVDRLFTGDGTCSDPPTEKSIRSLAQSLTDYIHHYVCPARTLEAMMREKPSSD